MFKRLFIFFFLGLNLGFAQDKKALETLETAEKLFKMRQYDNALVQFEKYLLSDTTNQLVFVRMAQIHHANRNQEKAIMFYEKAITFDVDTINYTQAYMYLGSRALERSDYNKAKEYLTVALHNTNRNAQAYQQLQKQLVTADLGIRAMENPLEIERKRMPDVINAREKQYFPVLTADENMLIFTAVTEYGDENLYISKKVNGEWQEPAELSDNINTPDNEGTCTISADGKIMVFTSCQGRESYGNCDLYITNNIGGQWSEPENLGPNVNSPYWDSQPSLSADGSKLYFSSDRPYGIGKKDIWMSEQDDKGNWKRAVNLGPGINTKQDEVSPFIHANGYSLFYSSNGKEGLGKHDIYITDLRDGYQAEAINLGYPINTPDDESGLFISANGETALYSTQVEDSVHIYKFKIPKELSAQFNKIYYIKGYVLDGKDQTPLHSSLEIVNQKNGERVSRFLSDPITGDYMTVLPEEGNYIMYVETPGYFFKSIIFDYQEDNENMELNIDLTKIEKNAIETLNNIFFDTGSADLRRESEIELKKLTKLMKENADLKVEISGHTDDVGNDQFNQNLSLKRADSVVKYLRINGIHTERMIAKGYGKTRPKVANDSDENRQLNRRIEIEIL